MKLIGRSWSDFIDCVTPCVGVWIEILNVMTMRVNCWVTPCVGVWIEIYSTVWSQYLYGVTPCVGVWIEIRLSTRVGNASRSLPAWECGLKYIITYLLKFLSHVTPCVGVWIEIYSTVWSQYLYGRHSLRGSVD